MTTEEKSTGDFDSAEPHHSSVFEAKQDRTKGDKRTAKRVVSKKIRLKPKQKKKTAVRRPYPKVTLEKSLNIPFALKENNGGNPWTPEDLAKSVGLSKKNTDFFYMAAASREFDLTDGSRDSEQIALTEFGRDLVYAPGKTEEKELLREALLKVEIFRKVLDYYKGSNLPEMQYLGNTLTREFGLDPRFHEEFSALFRENCTFLDIGSGFSADPSVKKEERTNENSRSSGSTVVLAEPANATGLRCFAIMPFRERENTRAPGFLMKCLGH